MAAQSYFGKPAKELTLEEGALLAGLPKGPNYYNPDRYPERAQERLAYVLSRMKEDGVIDRRRGEARAREQPRARRRSSGRAATPASTSSITSTARPRRSPGSRPDGGLLHGALDRDARPAAGGGDGLAGRAWRATSSTRAASSSRAPEANLGEAMRRIETAPKAQAEPRCAKPVWQQALENARGCRSTTCTGRAAVVLDEPRKGKSGGPPRRLGRRPRRAARHLERRHPARPQAL